MAVLISKKYIDDVLKTPPQKGKWHVEPFKSFALENNLPFKILEDSEVLDNKAEAHKDEGDLWFCLEGEVKFTYGGEMMDPRPYKDKDGKVNEKELQANGIVGGTEVMLNPGDWLWIPAGEPHQHSCEGTARLIIIKIPTK